MSNACGLFFIILYTSLYLTRRVSAFIYISSKKTLFISCGRNEPKTTKGGYGHPFAASRHFPWQGNRSPFETPNRLKGSAPLRIPLLVLIQQFPTSCGLFFIRSAIPERTSFWRQWAEGLLPCRQRFPRQCLFSAR